MALVEYVSNYINSENFELALHGYTHRFYPDGPEFVNSHISEQNIIDCKKYLEILFNVGVDFFVPPSNDISYSNYLLLKKNHLSLVTSSIVRCEGLKDSLRRNSRLVFENMPDIFYSLGRRRLVLNPIKLERMSILRSKTFRLDDTVDDYIARNEEQMERAGFISIATHYTVLCASKSYRFEFFKLLDKIDSKYGGIEFKTLRELYSKVG